MNSHFFFHSHSSRFGRGVFSSESAERNPLRPAAKASKRRANMMTRLFLAGVAALFFSACASTKQPVKTTAKTANTVTTAALATPTTSDHVIKRMTVRTTAYTHTEPGGIKNGIGGRLRFKSSVRSAASDWSWLPLGTRFRLAGSSQQYVIEDYGSALVGRQTIDMYMPTRGMMNAWGVRHVEIEILEWGSKAMSLRLLQDRQRHKHVRRMVVALRSQGVTAGG
jgi:3D (Asp-Asp-Asp) domain-containing protein